MKIKKYKNYFKESIDSKLDDRFIKIKEEILTMIEKSIKAYDINTVKNFIKAYIKDQENTNIEGLINDSDVYDFYIKYKNEVDDILLEINYFDESPSDMGVFGIYDYIIKSTKKSILELIIIIKDEI